VQIKRSLPIPNKVVLILGALAISCVQLTSIAFAQPPNHSKKKGKTSVQPLVCRSGKLNSAESPVADSGGHSVTLSWNASVSSPGFGKADGYCIYRSRKQGDALREKDCAECELLNRTPLPGTSCIDNTITDAPNYFYAVAAINVNGMSGPSNELSAPIPVGKPAGVPAPDIPFCGGASSSEKSSQQK
jgi:hypothetical protein